MSGKLLTLMIIIGCILSGCGHRYHWSKSHPAYNQAPYGIIAVSGTENAFVLTRSKWFAKRLEISPDSVQKAVTGYCENLFVSEMRKAYPTFTKIPDKEILVFQEESQKLDERIFMKGHLPDQGVAIKDSAGNIPPRILIIHEVIMGTDLKRENYFDYALVHNESSDQKTSEKLSAIVSYTLWDNEKQRPLFSAVDEIAQPITVISLGSFENLIKAIVQQIRTNMYTGVVQ